MPGITLEEFEQMNLQGLFKGTRLCKDFKDCTSFPSDMPVIVWNVFFVFFGSEPQLHSAQTLSAMCLQTASLWIGEGHLTLKL